MGDIQFLLVLLLAAAVLVRGADRIGVPYPIVLVVFGVAVGFVNGLPDVRIEPDAIFLVFLPPLLSSAGFAASPRELRAERRAIGVLAIVLVLATMGVVAVVAHAVIGGLGWPQAFVLGAIVGPTDPVAAVATFASVGVPERVALLVEGEAMVNDATALVALGTALTAATDGSFSVAHAAGDLVGSVAGGLAIGVAAGWLEVQALRRLDDRALAILLTLLVPYGAYVLADQSGTSGVLAAVTCGLFLGWGSHEAFDADTRLSGAAFWEILVFGLNALLFLLLGLELPAIADDVPDRLGSLVLPALAVSGAVIAIRLVVQFTPGVHADADWRERVAIGYSGMRGAVSLAAALAIPLSVHGRAQVVFATVVVILVTLVGQGLTLPYVLRLLGLRGERPWTPDEAIARLEAAQAALDRLDELEDDGAPEEMLRRLRELYRARFRACQLVLAGEGDVSRVKTPVRAYSSLRRELIGVEREALRGLRDDGRLAQDPMRRIQRDLDLEEARLRPD